jgi:hypothetical protein
VSAGPTLAQDRGPAASLALRRPAVRRAHLSPARSTPDAVVARRRSLQIPPRRARRWSRADDALLRVGTAAGLSAAVLAELLGRSPEQARARRRILLGRAPAGRPYLSHEDEVIRLCVRQDGDLTALPYRLGSSPGALCVHAQHLGLHRPSLRRRWAEWEDAVIRNGYTSALPYSEIARQLPDRSATSLAARARKLNLIAYALRRSIHDDERLLQLTVRGGSWRTSPCTSGGPRRRSVGVHRASGSTRQSWCRRTATVGGGPARRTSCCAWTMPSIPAAFAELLDAQTLPPADDCARLDCVPVPSAPRTIRGTAGSPRPPRFALRNLAGVQSDPRGLGRSQRAAGRLRPMGRGRCACTATAAPSRPHSAPSRLVGHEGREDRIATGVPLRGYHGLKTISTRIATTTSSET